jgi:FkbM family methyltransferase
MEGAFQGIAARGHDLRTVIDVGASDGVWSETFMRHYPNARYLLIEAQPVHQHSLHEFCTRHSNAELALAAAGDRAGSIFFDAQDPLGGQASYHPYPEHNIEVPVTTIDSEVEQRGLPGPYLIKLDTHGFEVPILRGAARTLEQTDVILMECYNFRLSHECLLFHEMCAHLEPLGFRCIDMVDVARRPYDGSLWQMDLVFVRSDRNEFGYEQYK